MVHVNVTFICGILIIVCLPFSDRGSVKMGLVSFYSSFLPLYPQYLMNNECSPEHEGWINVKKMEKYYTY